MPVLTGLAPATGPQAGGTSVTITGTGFTGATGVSFGTTPATGITVVSDTSIIATAPVGTGTVDVVVANQSGASSPAGTVNDFTYIPAPTVTALSPATGPLAGGTVVTLTGTNFEGATAVTFGTTPATNLTNITATSITATAPAGTGMVDVRVTTPGGTSSAAGTGNDYTYAAPRPVITNLSFSSGPEAGGRTIRISGSGFTGTTAVRFGTTVAGFQVDGDDSLRASVPAGTGLVDISVTTPGGTSDTTGSADDFTYLPAPTVTALSPATGPLAGGTVVTLTGTNFAGATAVTFGSTPGTNLTDITATSITVTAPAGSAGPVDVTVTTPGGTSATSGTGNDYTYVALPIVTLTGPGNLNEGDTGSGFSSWAILLDRAAVADVTVGYRTVAGTASTSDFGSISGDFVIRAGSLGGSVNVFITGDTLDENDETFTFELTSISANAALNPSASVATGTIVDNDAAPSFTIGTLRQAEGNSGQTNFVVPVTLTAASGKATSISLTTANDSATAGEDYVTQSPTLNFAPGETTQNFTLLVNGDRTVEGDERVRLDVAGLANLTAPEATFFVTILNDDVPAPTVSGLSTTAGPAAGGNTVIITGTNFTGATAVTFGANPATRFTVDSDTQITAVVPPLGQELLGGNVVIADVSVTTAGGTSSTAGTGDDYRYRGIPAPPLISTPTSGSIFPSNRPEIQGGASGADTVEVFIDGTSVGTTPVQAGTGNWFMQSPVLQDGPHTVRAVAISPGGQSASSATVTFTVDTTAPSIPVITSPTSGRILQTLTTVSGTGEPNTAVIVYINDGTAPPPTNTDGSSANPSGLQGYRIFGSAEVNANGLWSATRRTREPNGNLAQAMGPQSLGEAPVSIVALGQDIVGNQSGLSGVVTLTLDSTPPITPPSTSQTPAQGTTVNTSRPNFCGTGAEAGADVTVFVNGNPYARGLVTQGGSWCAVSAVGDAKPTESLSAVSQGLPAGPHSWYAVFTDAAGNNSTPTTTITFNIVLVAVTQTSVPNGAVASAYSQTLTATGGTGPYTFTLDAGALPAGLTLSTGGVLSGTPTAGGTFNFTVRATDSVSQSATQAFSLTIAAPTVTATSTVPAGRRGFAYSQTLTGSGGTGPYSFSLQSGALPAGITLSSTGVLSGTPTVIGSFPIGVRVTDSSTGTGPYSSVVNLTLVVNAAAITVTPSSLPGVMAGLPYEQVMSASGGAGTYTYAVTAGALPNGIILTSNGRLVGSSYAVGTFGFTVTATDSFSNTGSVALSLVILARPDPSQDPDVRGLNAAQAEATRRLTSTQIENFSRRLEDLRNGGTSAALSQGIQFQSGIADLGQQSDPRTRFGGGRMFDTPAYDPDRAELNAMLWQGQGSDDGTGPIGRGPSGLGLATGGAPALAGGVGGARADGGSDPTGGVRLWTGGSITVGERDADSGQAALSISSRGLSVGADFAVTPTFDLGFGGGMGEEATDVGSRDSSVDSSSWVGVVYGSWRPDDGIYVDGMLGHGSLSFDMSRRVTIDNSLVTGSRDGTAIFGSLAVGFDRLVGDGRLSTYGRLESLNAELDAYTETGSPFWALSYAARDVESLQGVVGGRYIWSRIGRDSIWTPSVRAEYRQELAEGGLQALRYADWVGGPVYQIDQSSWDRGELNLGFGLDVQTLSGWVATGEVTGRFSDGQSLGSVRLGLSRKF